MRPLQTRSVQASAWLALLAALAVVLVPQLFLFSHVADDAYIGFRYATRLAAGEGLTFNPGERVEGFSDPLWMLLLAGGLRLTPLSAPDVARGLGLLFTVLTVLCAWRFFCRPGGERSPAPAFGSPEDSESVRVAASRPQALGMADVGIAGPRKSVSIADFLVWSGIVLAAPGFHVYASSGLETPLLMCLFTCAGLATIRNRGADFYRAAGLLGLAGITRPEGALYGLLWYLSTWSMRKGWPRRREFILLGALFGPALVYEIFRLYYYGRMLPNTFVAKPPGLFGGDSFGFAYLWPWILSIGGPAIVLAAMVRGRPDGTCRRVLQACAGLILAAIIFVIYARYDWMPFGRFVVPVWPLIALVVTDGLRAITAQGLLRPVKFAKSVMAELLVLASLVTWAPDVGAYVRNEGPGSTLMRGSDQLAIGQWLAANVRAGSTVATRRLGGICYGAPGLIAWDRGGLTDAEQAAFISTCPDRVPDDLREPILKRLPDVIALNLTYRDRPDFVAWLNAHYRFIRSFPQGDSGPFEVWVARRTPSVLLSE
jgi:arabinofuranosyltransferase